MAELIATFLDALLNLVRALISLIVDLLAMLAESLGFAAGRLSEPPVAGESRFGAKRVALAFAPLLLLVAVVSSVVGYLVVSNKMRKERRRATMLLIETHLNSLTEDKDESGRYKATRRAEFEDAWGNQVLVTHKATLTHEHIEVRSSGPDSLFNTHDDLYVGRSNMLPKAAIAAGLLRRVKGALEAGGDD
jgi:hypothetical protein